MERLMETSNNAGTDLPSSFEQRRTRGSSARPRRREQRLQRLDPAAVLEAAPDAMALVDPEGRIALVNRQVAVLFGYTRADLVGQPIELLVPERFHAIHQGHRAHYVAQPRTRPMGTDLALFGRHKDGSEFPVAVSLSPLASAAPRDQHQVHD